MSKQEAQKSTEDKDTEVAQFDLNAIRINPENLNGEVARKLLTTVPVQKPGKHVYVRVHPDPTYRIDTAVFQFDNDREYYLVLPAAQSYFPTDIQFVTLYTAITRSGDVFLWPVRFPDESRRGGGRDWHQTARLAAEHAQSFWIRVQANMNVGRYDIHEAIDQLADPVWPDCSFERLVQLAFNDDRIVNREDHMVIRML